MIRTWLDAWLAEHDKDNAKAENIYENIDSLELIELICDIEKRFHFRFTEKDFQDRRLSDAYATIQNWTEVIEEKCQTIL